MAHVDNATARVIGVESEIRRVLFESSISGRELARRLGVSPPWVSLRLTGETAITVADVHRIAAALDVPVAQLLPTAEPAS
jgi:transcriptional regulator with XRE-family HTH domain